MLVRRKLAKLWEKIKNFQPVKGWKLSFGFILPDPEEEKFFHKKEVEGIDHDRSRA